MTLQLRHICSLEKIDPVCRCPDNVCIVCLGNGEIKRCSTLFNFMHFDGYVLSSIQVSLSFHRVRYDWGSFDNYPIIHLWTNVRTIITQVSCSIQSRPTCGSQCWRSFIWPRCCDVPQGWWSRSPHCLHIQYTNQGWEVLLSVTQRSSRFGICCEEIQTISMWQRVHSYNWSQASDWTPGWGGTSSWHGLCKDAEMGTYHIDLQVQAGVRSWKGKCQCWCS